MTVAEPPPPPPPPSAGGARLCMACRRLSRLDATCPACGGKDLVVLDLLLPELERRFQRVDKLGWLGVVPALLVATIFVAVMAGPMTGIVMIGVMGSAAIALGIRGLADPNRRLYRGLAGGPAQPLLPEARREFTGRAGGAGKTLRAPLSLRQAVAVRHDVIVHGARIAHCTSITELTVSTPDLQIRVTGPVELERAPIAARQGLRAEPQLLIEGELTLLASLQHAFGPRARIEERVIAEGDGIEVVAPADLVEEAGAGGDAYRSAASAVIRARPGRPARISAKR